MGWFHTATLVFHVLVAAAIVGLVLLQRGRGADAGAGFGAGASGTVFGARGSASFLSRATAMLATLFIATSLTLTYLGSRPDEAPTSVIDRLERSQPAPRATEPPANEPAGSAERTLPELPAAPREEGANGADESQPTPR
ncbi:MAG: preprotein translocase subunit SecG [Proteobacteria bacterium]|nr:MAG: preprotein translocase subunit SecG [Pseudomonadota bacterium]